MNRCFQWWRQNWNWRFCLLVFLSWELIGGSARAGDQPVDWPELNTNSVFHINKGFSQGWAFDDFSEFDFETGKITRFDLNWQTTARNVQPFAGLKNYNHLGAGTYYRGKIYVAMEDWHGCGNVTNQSIGVFGADLRRLSVLVVSNYQNEISAVTVAPDLGTNGTVFTASFCDGAHLFEYALPDLNHVKTLTLSQNISLIQGIGYRKGLIFVDADQGTNGLIYAINPLTGEVRQLASLTVSGAREYEGLDVSQGDLRISEGATGLYFYKFKDPRRF